MKKLISLLLCLIMVFCVTVPTFAADKPIKVRLCNYMNPNGKWVSEKYIKFDVEPQIIDGRTMVPVRAVAEELGYSVGWNQKDQRVTFQRYIEIDKDSKNYYDNFNQLKRVMNLFYRIEGGEKIDNFSELYYTPTHIPLSDGAVGYVSMADSMKYLAVGDILGRKTEAKKYLECHFTVENNHAWCNLFDTSLGELSFNYKMDVPAKVIDNRTLVPLRAFGEILGLDVSWDNENRRVTISA